MEEKCERIFISKQKIYLELFPYCPTFLVRESPSHLTSMTELAYDLTLSTPRLWLRLTAVTQNPNLCPQWLLLLRSSLHWKVSTLWLLQSNLTTLLSYQPTQRPYWLSTIFAHLLLQSFLPPPQTYRHSQIFPQTVPCSTRQLPIFLWRSGQGVLSPGWLARSGCTNDNHRGLLRPAGGYQEPVHSARVSFWYCRNFADPVYLNFNY